MCMVKSREGLFCLNYSVSGDESTIVRLKMHLSDSREHMKLSFTARYRVKRSVAPCLAFLLLCLSAAGCSKDHNPVTGEE